MGLNQQHHTMTLKLHNDFWSIEEDFVDRHHTAPRVSSLRAERRLTSNSTEVYCRDQDNSHKSGCVARKTYQGLLECRKG